MDSLENILGYKFDNIALLEKAITHSSVVGDTLQSYERLEFLGDRVLGVAVAAALYEKYPFELEGKLSQRFVQLVCKETVAEVGLSLGIEKFIKVEQDCLRENVNVLCDVVEAIIGAIFVDGGIDKAIDFVNRNWNNLLLKDITPPKDSKSKLQEKAHSLGFGMPVYTVIDRLGSEHEPIFIVKVSLGNGKSAKGEGKNKKQAEFEAATKLLKMMECVN